MAERPLPDVVRHVVHRRRRGPTYLVRRRSVYFFQIRLPRPDVDYICFTDHEYLTSSTFEIIHVPPIYPNSTRNARMVKTLSHIFLQGYEASLWIDGSTKIRGNDFKHLFEEALTEHAIAVHSHFQRACIYDEARECIAQKKDRSEVIERQIRFYRDQRYPEGAGLVETAQVFRRHTEEIARFNEAWWSLVRDYSVRDQLSFNFVSWQLDVKYQRLQGCQWLDPYFKNHFHVKRDWATLKCISSVSIIMLVRDSLDVTKKSISSILKETRYDNFQLIVVDNASGDETKRYLASVVSSDPRVRVMTNKENESFSRANNDAAKTCDSTFFLFINNDVEIIDKNWLLILVSSLENDSLIGAAGPILLYGDYTVQSAGIEVTAIGDTVQAPAKENKKYTHSYFADAITGACLLVRADLHRAVGGFDERFFYGQEDIDYCLKLRELGFKLKVIVDCEVIHHESKTRAFNFTTLRNREVLRLKWRGRFASLPPSKSPVSRVPKAHLVRSYADLLRERKISYRSLQDLSVDLRRLVALIPEKVDLVVGVPRSGMVPAILIGQMKNCAVISLDEFVAGIEPVRGDRPQNFVNKGCLEVLVVDDSINNGNAYRRARQMLKSEYRGRACRFTFLAVYGSDLWRNDDVLTLVSLPIPRLFQWNYTNHGIAGHACYDLDGVLCVDPTDEENDDGKLYRQFILNAQPLYIPKYRIKAIVTSRLEKYRKETEAWLEANDVKYEKLYMLDLPSKEDRMRSKAHGSFKSEVYKSLSSTYLFLESNDSQAQEIAKKVGKPVICTENDKLY
ncbi:glycosyltransferase [Rhodoplanes sp. SY1]|uniref:glycosyltransferase n=1 Tax=Rhodoplanes sp. SY1 TaxID=3166646 RepID=UPI0038B4F26A